MKKSVLFASAAMILTAGMASANPFADVPYSHWAYDAVNLMAQKGIVQGFPDGAFKGNQQVTRYQLAMIVSKMMANVEQMGGVSAEDLKTLERLTVEFADELALLGVKVTALEDDMKTVKEDVSGLKNDVDAMKKGGVGAVKLSGDMLVRNYGFKTEGNGKDRKAHRTETTLRLAMDAQVSENISARARWNVIENNNDNRGMTNEWNGGNKNTGSVDIAYIKIKDMFGFGGDFKFGRDWYQHGHGFVMHDFMDAVGYEKRCGDIDLALNCFFERQGGDDYYNIWNVNADYSYKAHDMYLGFYYNTRAYAHVMPEDTWNKIDNKHDLRIELGSHGRISNNNDKLTYDVAAVYSKIEDAKLNESGEFEDGKGWLGHVAINYDSQKQLTAKLAYTFGDEDSLSAVSVDNNNRYCMDHETIFDDIYLVDMVYGHGTNYAFHNLKDLKVQLGYTLKNADKHNFRLAYDNVQNKKDGEPNTFSYQTATPATNGLKANIITFEYTYQLAENARIRLGYQNSKVEADIEGSEDQKSNLYFTELYTRF